MGVLLSFSSPSFATFYSSVFTPLLCEEGCALSNKPYMESGQNLTKYFHQSPWTVYIHLQLHHHLSCTNSIYSGYIMTLKTRKKHSGAW